MKQQEEMKVYLIKNVHTAEILRLSLVEILEEINRDRSQDWTPYDETDWQEGLEAFTEYTLIKQIKDNPDQVF